MSSFKIRPVHERIFNSVQTVGAEPPQELVEETVFVVDEETGEISEEKQMVPKDPSSQPSKPITQPLPKDNRFMGLAMRKKTKVRFM